MQYEYQFPEKVPFRAKEVTEPEFYIQSRKDWFNKLWVDFSPVRSNDRFKRMKFDLGMMGNKVENIPNEYIKIIFSGHRGCGKSVELKRFSDEIDHKDAFFTVFIDLEQETNIEQITPEDIYVILISLLIRKLEEHSIRFKKSEFVKISEEWLAETQLQKSVSNEYGLDAAAEASVGWSFWQFLSLKGNLRGYYSRKSNATKSIRQKIKTNPKELLNKLNTALSSTRKKLLEKEISRDIIFFIDGLEKANPNVYESLFVNDVQMITGIKAHIITTVPIRTFYEILHLPVHDYFRDFYMPMIRVNSESKELLKEIVARRVDENLLSPGVIDTFIEYSGGCPRILLKLVNRGILNALGDQVNIAIAEEVIIEEGHERWRALTEKHKEILINSKFESADMEIFELLQSLNLLEYEYDGLNPERLINPLIERFLNLDK